MTVMFVASYGYRISVRAFGIGKLGFPSWFSAQACPGESTDAIVNRILAAGEERPFCREEICLDYIRKLCASGDLQSAVKVPHALIEKRIFPGYRAYDCLLEAADRENDFHLLFQVFRDLHFSCRSVGLNSYLIVAKAFGKHDDSSMLLRFVVDVCHMKLIRSVGVILNRIIYALAKCGYPDRALLVFNYMKSSRNKPDLVSYNTVLAFLGRLARVDEMLCEFDCLKKSGYLPDIVTYNTILHSLRKMGRLDLCLVYFKEMTERGIQLDVITFKALIESYGRSGNMEEALRVFDDMSGRGIHPSIHIYRALVYSLKKMGKLDLAFQFLAEMKKLQVSS